MSGWLTIRGDMDWDEPDPIVAFKEGRIVLYLDNRKGFRITCRLTDPDLLAQQLQQATELVRE